MYVGRITAIARSKNGEMVALYRVSSRSFPNRGAKKINDSVAILPKEEFKNDALENPYISYNCLRYSNRYAVIGNGTHTDPIFEKLNSGMNMRDSMISVLFAMDYEHDSLNTPRIAAIANVELQYFTLGIIRDDYIQVQNINLEPGTAQYIATYNHDYVDVSFKDEKIDFHNAVEGCEYLLNRGIFKELEKPITAVCAYQNGAGFEIAIKDYIK